MEEKQRENKINKMNLQLNAQTAFFTVEAIIIALIAFVYSSTTPDWGKALTIVGAFIALIWLMLRQRDVGNVIDKLFEDVGENNYPNITKIEQPNHSEYYSSSLQRISERSISLGSLIQNTNGVFLTAFLVFFETAIFGYANMQNPLIPIVCLSMLFVWRYYIHFIDTENIDIYRRIIHCESKINFSDEKISLKRSLQIQRSNNILFPNRGQLFFDIIAGLIMVALFYGYRDVLYADAILYSFVIVEIGLFAFFVICQTNADTKNLNKLIEKGKEIEI
jgi:hypothetical protein